MQRSRAAVCTLLVLLATASAHAQGAQTPTDPPPRFSLEFGVGSHLTNGGDVEAVSFGYRPHPDMTLLVMVERDYIPTRVTQYPDGYSATRGGTLAFVSGEFRYTVPIGTRVSPYGFLGRGIGLSRPHVDEWFPQDARTRTTDTVYLGGGARIRLRPRLDLFVDAKFMFHADREGEGLGAMVPIRGGIAWLF